MKKNLIKDGFELSEKIGQLKLKSQDGKYRMTDVCDIERMFRIIELIPSCTERKDMMKNGLLKE